jgi:hypothetical protein
VSRFAYENTKKTMRCTYVLQNHRHCKESFNEPFITSSAEIFSYEIFSFTCFAFSFAQTFYMETGLVHLHNVLRWIILFCLIAAIIRSYSGWQYKKPFGAADRKLWLFTMIAAHITLLLGLYQWLFGRFGALTTDLPAGTSVMKSPFYRFFWIEHPTLMIVAIVLITLGRGMAKKSVSDVVKYKKAFWYFFIALLLILAAVPWPFRKEIGRPLLPGMTVESTK